MWLAVPLGSHRRSTSTLTLSTHRLSTKVVGGGATEVPGSGERDHSPLVLRTGLRTLQPGGTLIPHLGEHAPVRLLTEQLSFGHVDDWSLDER